MSLSKIVVGFSVFGFGLSMGLSLVKAAETPQKNQVLVTKIYISKAKWDSMNEPLKDLGPISRSIITTCQTDDPSQVPSAVDCFQRESARLFPKIPTKLVEISSPVPGSIGKHQMQSVSVIDSAELVNGPQQFDAII
jgi:hypothetical protein